MAGAIPIIMTPPAQPKQFAPAEQWPPSGGYPITKAEDGPLPADPNLSKLK